MTRVFLIAAAFALASPVLADDAPTGPELEKIMNVLNEMQCEMDPADIELDEEGYELDDVFCADGQYDIELSREFEVIEKRKE